MVRLIGSVYRLSWDLGIAQLHHVLYRSVFHFVMIKATFGNQTNSLMMCVTLEIHSRAGFCLADSEGTGGSVHANKAGVLLGCTLYPTQHIYTLLKALHGEKFNIGWQ